MFCLDVRSGFCEKQNEKSLKGIVKVLLILQYITQDTKKVRQDENIDDIYHLFVN